MSRKKYTIEIIFPEEWSDSDCCAPEITETLIARTLDSLLPFGGVDSPNVTILSIVEVADD